MDRRHLKDHALRMNGGLPGIEKRKKQMFRTSGAVVAKKLN